MRNFAIIQIAKVAKLRHKIMAKTKEYIEVTTYSDIFASEPYIPMLFKRDRETNDSLRVLSLFSGCGIDLITY